LVSTQPLAVAEAMQAHVSRLIVGAGVATGILGAIAVAVALLVWRAIRRRKPDDRDAEADEPAVPGPDADADADAGGGVDVELADRMQELEDSNRSMRLVLDNTAQGFLAVDLVGRVTSERSAVIHRWFGEPVVGTMLGDYLSAHSREFALQFSGALDSLCAGMLPLQDCLDQMPKRLTTDANAFDVRYAPLLRDDRPERILLIIDDVSEQVVRERAEQEQREQRELAALSQLIVDGRAEFDEFFAEAAGLVSSLDTPGEPEVERGTLRKLKESCAYYGLETYVELCTRIEATVADLAGPISDQDRVALSQVWGRIASRLASRMA
jgi:PAS domain-containing protein